MSNRIDFSGARQVSSISWKTADKKGESSKPSRLRIAQNYILLWLDSSIDEFNPDFKHNISLIRCVVNSVHTFIRSDDCIDFLNQIQDVKVFLIMSDTLIQQSLSIIHDNKYVEFIYIFCNHKTKHGHQTNRWNKIKGEFTGIKSICDILKQDIRQCDHDLIPISILSSSTSSHRDLNELDQSFMYSQLLKEILLKTEFDKNAKNKLADYCGKLYHDNERELEVIEDFRANYFTKTPIWWYTRECFTYHMLNQALRTQDIELIITMGFFLRDLHKQIEEVYEQNTTFRESFMVYRGQGLCTSEFEKLKVCNGGLLAFNSFLSTSTNRQVSLQFASNVQHKKDTICVLFQIQIHPTLISTPFASLDEISYYSDSEKEVLFSMHAVFRIGNVTKIGNEVWQVDLTSTTDTDPQLQALAKCLRDEIEESNSWDALGKLMITMGQFGKAEEIYQVLIDTTTGDKNNELAHYVHQLGYTKGAMGDHQQALDIYQKSFELQCNSSKPDKLLQATIYNSIGLEYDKMSDYSTALSFYEKALEIRKLNLSSDHPDLAAIYNNIGLIYNKLGNNVECLRFLQQTLVILEKALSPNHPDLSSMYNNIASVYEDMKDCSTALAFYQKALNIEQKTLAANHPDLATTFNNIAGVYHRQEEYSTALSFYEKALAIYEKSLTANHPSLAYTYCNIGVVHKSLGHFQIALSFYERAMDIGRHRFPSNHSFMKTLQENLNILRKHLREMK